MLGIVDKLRSLRSPPRDGAQEEASRSETEGAAAQTAAGPAHGVSGERPIADDPEVLTDTIGSILRSLGEGAFAIGDEPAAVAARAFDAWARHALVRAPNPNHPEQPVARRDWSSIRRFVQGHRQREQAYVTQTVEGLRGAVWSFVHGTSRVLRSNDDHDKEVVSHIKRLHGALGVRSVEKLRQEVDGVAQALEKTLQTWREQQAAQVAELRDKLSKLSTELDDARREGARDGLTRLYNRKALDAYLERVSDMYGLCKAPSSLLLVDVDHFKSVNDSHGHPMGDEVLRKLADCLVRAFCRRTDFVARYGGEEFAVVLNDVHLKDAHMPAERLMTMVRNLGFSTPSKVTFGITVSAGISGLDERGVSSWLERADRSLYDAKATGRNRIVSAA